VGVAGGCGAAAGREGERCLREREREREYIYMHQENREIEKERNDGGEEGGGEREVE
jgi:hypothetical protein